MFITPVFLKAPYNRARVGLKKKFGKRQCDLFLDWDLTEKLINSMPLF
jgi:hypothetical protein